MSACEHESMEHAYGMVWRCADCGYEETMTAADFGWPDTRKEERE